MKKFTYKVTKPMLPSDAVTPMMTHEQMTAWLNDMDEQGWEFVGFGQKHWIGAPTQEWWIFRKPVIPSNLFPKKNKS